MIIIIAELAFWVLVIAGLLARYALKMVKVSRVLLLAVPFVDVVLLLVAVIDLRAGHPVEVAYQLVGLYLGISIILGPSIIQWCDTKVRGIIERTGTPKEEATWGQTLWKELIFLAKYSLAVGIGSVINLGLLQIAVNDPQREALKQAMMMPLNTILIVAIVGPIWHLLFLNARHKKREKNRKTIQKSSYCNYRCSGSLTRTISSRSTTLTRSRPCGFPSPRS